MKTGNLYRVFYMALIIMAACKQHYMPPVLTFNRNYLVVDGVIVTNNDSTVIKLSRTIRISDTILPAPETGALVSVVSENNSIYPLTEGSGGRYFSPGLNLNTTQKYRLNITTSDGKQYQSDLVEAKQSPPIDSVYWHQDESNNVKIEAATHDPANIARYYRYEYVETWQYQADYLSLTDWVDSQPVLRTPDQQVFYCWSSQNSSNIIINSTANLSRDVAVNIPIAEVADGSEKIGYKYSILVNQYSLTKDAWQFWSEMKKSTEQLGTLFDPEPTQIPTNIHCITNPGEEVIGYVSVSSLQSVRIFINRLDLGFWHFHPYYDAYQDLCVVKEASPDSMNYFFPAKGRRDYVLLGKQLGSDKYKIVFLTCADCREHGGTNIKPLFWP